MRKKLLTPFSSYACAQCHRRITHSQIPSFFSTSQPKNRNLDIVQPVAKTGEYANPAKADRPSAANEADSPVVDEPSAKPNSIANDDQPASGPVLDKMQRAVRTGPYSKPLRIGRSSAAKGTKKLLDDLQRTRDGLPLEGVEDARAKDADVKELADLSLKETEQRNEEIVSEPHHLNIYATKHNTHITLTRPNRTPIFSFSCGSRGAGGHRKGNRGTYDAAYQLCAYSLDHLKQKGYTRDIKKLEVIYRGFHPGREAFTKALLGTEGRAIRDLVVRVTDATRLKFGGTRSPKVRRLG